MVLKLKMEEGGDCCVYAIINKVTDKYYVGSTTRRYARWLDHCRMLEQNRHHSPKLQASYNKHGPDAFEFIILTDECTPEELPGFEQAWLEQGDCYENGYNILPEVAVGAPLLQRDRVAKKWADPEQRKRHAERIRELWQTKEYRDKMMARSPRRTKVLVVCHANEYRSPLAAALLGKYSHLEVRQGGVKSADFGHRCAKKVREAAPEAIRGKLELHRSRKVLEEDVKWAQYVLYMDQGNREKLPGILGGRKAYCLAQFADPPQARIPDPAFMRKDSQELVATVALIQECVAAVADALLAHYSYKRAPLLAEGRT